MRKAEVSRTTAETALSVKLDLDGTGGTTTRPASASSTTCSTSSRATR